MFETDHDETEKNIKGTVFNIEHFHVHDGEGIRTNVFLKGCVLHCPWCCNPESIDPEPQIAHYANLCTGCGKCIKACPSGCCIRGEEGKVITLFNKCIACGECVKVCPAAARELFGRLMSVHEVMAEVEKDAAYFMNSGGGLTISGGEACMQAEFARALAEAAHRRYFPVALETAAAVPWERLWLVAEAADEILFDIKTLSEDQFRRIGKISPDIVKNNLSKLAAHDKIITLRCPVIPGFNDTEEHLKKIEKAAKDNGIKRVDILPFHQLGKHKYEAVGKEYQMGDVPEMNRQKAEELAVFLNNLGLEVSVGG